MLILKCLECVLDESGTDDAECRKKVGIGGKLQVLLGSWLMVGDYNLSVQEFYMKHCSWLFLCMEGEGDV